MNYETFEPSADLRSIVKCYWTLEVPRQDNVERQLIIPDGCIEMIFILGDDVRRFTTGDQFIIQPRAMILGQITGPFYVQPSGAVNSFAVRFYPFGFWSFVSLPIKDLANRETPLHALFGEAPAQTLYDAIRETDDARKRIEVIESFLLGKLADKTIIDNIVSRTVDAILSSKGHKPIGTILKDDPSKRRQLERKFLDQIGMSPKQLGRVIRLQSALQRLLNQESASLTEIAYESEYYDQAHFIKDFKDFTGTTPKAFIDDSQMALSSVFYRKS